MTGRDAQTSDGGGHRGPFGVFWSEVRDTIAPRRDNRDGPLPPMLVALTVVTGLVDAFSYLRLGHVFVANMTGNVVLLGFALGGAKGFSIPASLVAIGSFSLGALVGARVTASLARNRGHLLSAATAMQAAMLVVTVVLAAFSPHPVIPGDYRYPLILVLALSMGIQNAAARKVAVPDLTTSVLTLTITGISADSEIAAGGGSRAGRRVTSVIAMLFGAVVGALLILHVSIAAPLAIAAGLAAVVAATSFVFARPAPEWVRPRT